MKRQAEVATGRHRQLRAYFCVLVACTTTSLAGCGADGTASMANMEVPIWSVREHWAHVEPGTRRVLAALGDPLLAQSAVDRLQSCAWALVREGASCRRRRCDPRPPRLLTTTPAKELNASSPARGVIGETAARQPARTVWAANPKERQASPVHPRCRSHHAHHACREPRPGRNLQHVRLTSSPPLRPTDHTANTN
jgi:hypothetical protein